MATPRMSKKSVTFMPKPVFEDNGSGMHSHMSLWKEGEPLFAGEGYAGCQEGEVRKESRAKHRTHAT